MQASSRVEQLVEEFHKHLGDYKSSNYNESNVKRDFIEPFFKELGWDVYNQKQYAHNYRDVITEDFIKSTTNAGAPDYSFRVGGVRKFFVEAKKPSIALDRDRDSALQVKRYGWNARLPISILTDFEEFAIYDTRVKPENNENPYNSRLLYLTYEDYLNKWDDIANLISQEAILQGKLDEFIEKEHKKGTSTVDHEFLKDIEAWREQLARNIVLRNNISEAELNYAVQIIIDRIIFLRICEDRNIEPYGRLLALTKQADIYRNLQELFFKADSKYNSGLFNLQVNNKQNSPKDEITPYLRVDDKVLKQIIKGLYYPCPYEFSVIPTEILGNIYEKFIGKEINITSSGKRINVEYKPEVRKAGGVYYTPNYIVDYIVSATVGELVKNKTPEEVSELAILDPACGSGSFLLGAYGYLLAWHLEYYSQFPEHYREYLIQDSKGGFKLTISECKRILLNNIYGVDIDSQAVEVTKLSLLLKVLEDEKAETIDNYIKTNNNGALPELAGNIKCGNSLVSTDIYKQMPDLSSEEKQKINPFDWENEFPKIFENGGFDGVIGNPPYIRGESLGETKKYISNYEVFCGSADYYTYFCEKAYHLLRKGGVSGFILSNKWLLARYGEKLRSFLKNYSNLRQLIDLSGSNVFKEASVDSSILIFEKRKARQKHNIFVAKDLASKNQNHFNIQQQDLEEKGFYLIPQKVLDIKKKIEAVGTPLKDWDVNIFRGILTGYNKAFIIDNQTKEALCREDPKSAEILKPLLRGRDIDRYSYNWQGLWLINSHNGYNNYNRVNVVQNYPAIYNYLQQFKNKLVQRQDKGDHWTNLRNCAYLREFEKEKIIWSDISAKNKFNWADNKSYMNNTCYLMTNITKTHLGILNSSLILFYFKFNSISWNNNILRWTRQYVEQIPIPKLNLQNPKEKARHDKMVELVDKMLELKEQTKHTYNPHTQNQLEREIGEVDREIDQLVYSLYGLTSEEIKIIEDEVKK